jgi:predicted phage-related endonuclease
MNDELIKKHLELKAQIDELTKEDEEIKKDIKLEMRAADLTDYENDEAIVVFKEVKKQVLDKEKVKELVGEEKLEECFKESSYDMLTVKLK